MNYQEQQKMRERMKEVERLARSQEVGIVELKALLESVIVRVAALEERKVGRPRKL